MLDQLADAKLEFELTNFKTGDVSEIATIPWGDLVSQPAQSSHVLNVRSGIQDFRDSDGNVTEWKFGDPSWDSAPKVPPETISKVMEMNVSQVIQLGGSLWTYPGVVYSRYATYSVTLKFRGKRVGPYKAAFFFGRNTKGEEVVSPQDQIVDSNSLFAATRESFYPTGLLRSRLRETAVASEWLKKSKIDDASCQSGMEELCCSELGCGVSETDLQRELSVPLKPLRSDATNQ